MTPAHVREAIDAVWRIESARVVARLARMVRDVGLAEELAQDALVTALEKWPQTGIPEKPGAWLMTTARNRALDRLRRGKMSERKLAELGPQEELLRDAPPDVADRLDDDVGDDLLRLVFIACHPVLPQDARVALTLRLVGGLTTEEIARAFLVAEPTVAQRIVRAKRTLAEKKIPFELPPAHERVARLASVLEVLYFIFNEGYSATTGDDWMRPALCEDALRLVRILCGLVPQEPEAWGLAALMEIQASRTAARRGPDGEPVLLLEQNRALWNRLLIQRGLAALERAQQLGGDRGIFTLQAAIAACHARAVTADQTDWYTIVSLYGELQEVAPSPVVELNRAVAVSMAQGPQAALVLVDALLREPALERYHLLPSVRGDLLFRLGRLDEARVEFERAADMTENARERTLLLNRARACTAGK